MSARTTLPSLVLAAVAGGCTAPGSTNAVLPLAAGETSGSRQASIRTGVTGLPGGGWSERTTEESLLAADDKRNRPDPALPIGVGATSSPGMFLIGGAADFLVDDEVTAGPALQFGTDDGETLLSAFGQAKYWLPVGDDSKLQPYLQAGLGFTYLDLPRRGGDSGLMAAIGAGVRLRTGDNASFGTQLLLHYLPNEIAGEDTYFSWEIVQFVLSF